MEQFEAVPQAGTTGGELAIALIAWGARQN